MDRKYEIAKLLSEKTMMSPEDIMGIIETPPDMALGDFAFPCFRLAKQFRKSPQMISQEIASGITELPSFLERIEVKRSSNREKDTDHPMRDRRGTSSSTILPSI